MSKKIYDELKDLIDVTIIKIAKELKQNTNKYNIDEVVQLTYTMKQLLDIDDRINL